MQITVEKLRSHLGILEGVIPRKNPSVEALTYALVDDGVLYATDLETAVLLEKLWRRWAEGAFPNYAQLVPTENAHRAELFAEELRQAVRLVAPLAQDASGIVRLAWSRTTMTVRARSDAVGEVEGRVALRRPSEHEGAIAFNGKYLLEYLEDKSGPVLLETNSPSAPGVWSVAGQPQVVLMPMFVQNDSSPTPPPASGSPAQVAPGQTEEPQDDGQESDLDDDRAYAGREDPGGEDKEDGAESVA